MNKWKKVDVETYNREQGNKASYGGSTSQVATKLSQFFKCLGYDPKQPCYDFSIYFDRLVNTPAKNSAKNCMGRMKKAYMGSLITEEVHLFESDSNRYYNKEPLDFGSMCHEIVLERRLKDYSVHKDNQSLSFSYAYDYKILNQDMYNYFKAAEQKFYELLEGMGEYCILELYIEMGYIKYYPTIVYPANPDIKENPSFRMKCDCIAVNDDTLYIWDLKTTKDMETFNNALPKYQLQILYYLMCMVDERWFLTDILQRKRNINCVKGGFLTFDKSVNELSYREEFVITDDLQNLIKHRDHDMMDIFENFSEMLVGKTE